MDKRSFLLGVAVVLVVVGVANMVMAIETVRFRCLAINNEKNLGRFGGRLQVDWNENSSTWYKTLVYGPQQIGGKVRGCPCFVFNYTSRWHEDPVRSIAWEGFREIECPENVAGLVEPIRDTTEYRGNTTPIKTEY